MNPQTSAQCTHAVDQSSSTARLLDPVTHINKLYTTVFCRHTDSSTGHEQVLLGMKKRGLGVDYWNGFGGKVEPNDQSIESAAARELYEECGLTASKLSLIGILLQQFPGQPRPYEIHIFTTNHFTGNPIETDEMAPRWFDTDKIPFDSMWKDDIDWYRHMLNNQPFIGYYLFGANHCIIRGVVELVDQSVIDEFKAESVDYDALPVYRTSTVD